MANAEIEKTLKKITDTQLVVVQLMKTHERKWKKRSRMSRVRTGNLVRRAERLSRAVDKLWRTACRNPRRGYR
jgi:uncharacterized phage-like protein YoqJ